MTLATWTKEHMNSTEPHASQVSARPALIVDNEPQAPAPDHMPQEFVVPPDNVSSEIEPTPDTMTKE